MRGISGISINQLGKESNSLEIGSLAGKVCTHRGMDKQKLSKNSKGQLRNDKNIFSFLMKSFY